MIERKNLRIEAEILLVGSTTIRTDLKRSIFIDMARLVQELKDRKVDQVTPEKIEAAVNAYFDQEEKTLDKVKLTHGARKVNSVTYYPAGCVNVTPFVLSHMLQELGVQHGATNSIEAQVQIVLNDRELPARKRRRAEATA